VDAVVTMIEIVLVSDADAASVTVRVDEYVPLVE
jgi:hypothetical protein